MPSPIAEDVAVKPPRRRPLFWPAVVAAVLPLLAFSPVLVNGFVNWDDRVAILKNPSFNPPTVQSLKYFWTEMDPHNEFFVPVNYTTWWLLAHVARDTDAEGKPTLKPQPFHAINWLTHAANSVLVLMVLYRLTHSRWPACAGALLFSLHPLQAEPVAWASSMYSSLSGFFSLLAIWQYLRFSDRRFGPPPDHASPVGRDRGAWRPFVLATIAYAAALLTKPVAVVVPAMVLVIELFLRRRRLRDLLIPLGTWAAVSMPAILLAQASQAQPEVYVPELMWRFLVALDALAFYLWKLVLPLGLAPDYGRSPRWLLGEGPVLYTWMAPAVFLALAWAVRDRARWPLACLLLFVAALLPTLGLVPFDYQRYSTVADRYAYLAMLAPAVALAWVLSRHARSALVALAFLVVLGLGVLAARQTTCWYDTQTLFRQTLAVNPKSLAALSVFAYVEDLQGRPDKALEMYGQALENNPGDARTMYNIGNVYLGRGKPAEAAAAYRQALGGMGRHSTLRSNFGLALAQLGRLDEAKMQLEEAIAINPRNAHAHQSLGTVLAARRDFAGARQHYETALRIDPKLDAAKDALEQLRAAGR